MTENKNNNVNNFSHDRVLVVGLGKTGLSCVEYLHKRGVEVAITDSRKQPPALDKLNALYPDVATFIGGFSEEAFLRATCLIVSPGVSVYEPLISEARAKGVEIIGDIELFSRNADAPVIAITGSNGKSTVTTLIGEIAKQADFDVRVGGNIGVPALELLHEPKPDLYVLELSSFQLETTKSLNAKAAVILNISEDHMDRYNNLQDYIAAKARIYYGAETLILNKDDQRVMTTVKAIRQGRKQVSFTTGNPGKNEFGIQYEDDRQYLCFENQKILATDELRIKGLHNYSNVLAAFALAREAGISFSDMVTAAQAFNGLVHRSQWVAETAGVTWINDSKATNVGASIAAINGMTAKGIILIAGGQGKEQDFSPLCQVLKDKVKLVLLIGEDAELIAETISDCTEVKIVNDLEQAVLIARDVSEKGDIVLLSPACASFDMFSGYEERGERFMKLVTEVIA